MSSTPVSLEIVSAQSSPAKQSATALSFDPKLAQSFIYKSVSEETRSAYTRAIRELLRLRRTYSSLSGNTI